MPPNVGGQRSGATTRRDLGTSSGASRAAGIAARLPPNMLLPRPLAPGADGYAESPRVRDRRPQDTPAAAQELPSRTADAPRAPPLGSASPEVVTSLPS